MGQRVLFFHFTLTDKEGETIDSSRDVKPLPIMEGAQQIIPALEKELFSMSVGEKKKVALSAEEAYGVYNKELQQQIQRSQLPEGDFKVGTQLTAGNEPNSPIFVIKKIEGDTVHLDGNHPLAGIDLVFDVEVTELRDATPDELSHGHAHGPDGHHH